MAIPAVHKAVLSRRTVLKAATQGCTLGALASAFGYAATPGLNQEVVGSTCLSIFYRNREGVTFDHDYYRDHHMPLIMEKYGSAAISRYELRKPVVVQAQADAQADTQALAEAQADTQTVAETQAEAGIKAEAASAPDYLACANIWIRDVEAFAAAGARYGAEMAADMPYFTNAALVVQNEIVWGEAGRSLDSPELGQTCVTILYPRQEAASWDADYYRDKHMPLLMRLYGTEAIRRFELHKPTPLPPGTTPAFLGTVNIYIEDLERFAAASAEHAQTLVADVVNISSVTPVVIPAVIYGLYA
jgi:uncharacterized protein (TIGR02118 family)